MYRVMSCPMFHDRTEVGFRYVPAVSRYMEVKTPHRFLHASCCLRVARIYAELYAMQISTMSTIHMIYVNVKHICYRKQLA